MKLENLLASYLYQHKKLDLPGIGTFELSGLSFIQDESNKHTNISHPIRFIQNVISEPGDHLIEYIKAHTGKMKALAMADLESYLILSKQFLNIGKPFRIEGIGTLLKMKDNSYQFTQEDAIAHAEESNIENTKIEIKSRKQENAIAENSDSKGARKALLALAAMATIALIGWGGYYLYETNSASRETTDSSINSITYISDSTITAQAINPDSSLLLKDTSIIRTDSPAFKMEDPAMAAASAQQVKFIFETTTNKRRALYRFDHVNKISRRIQLEAKPDSSLFKIFVMLPAAPADTGRIKDSLNAWYYGKKEMKIRLEP